MRVLIDTIGVSGQGGGAVVSELLGSLPPARPDWDFGVCLMRPEARDYESPRPNERFTVIEDSRGGGYLGRYRWLRQDLPELVERWRPDAILSLSNLLPTRGTVPKAVLIHQLNVLPGVQLAEGLPLKTRLRYSILRRAVRASARSAGAVVVQTEQMRDGLLRLDRRLAGRIHVIPTGFRSDVGRWPLSERVQSVVQDEAHTRLITYVSYPRPHKNHLRLLEAWRQVHKRLPGWRLALTLSSSEDYSGMGWDTRRIFSLIEDGGMGESVVLLGNLNPREVDWTLRHSAWTIFPSLAESFGLPLAEAMHSQCPILASDLPFAREVAGPAAEYFDPYSESQIAEAILRSVPDEALRERLRQAGRERESLFDYRNIADRYCRMLEDVCLT